MFRRTPEYDGVGQAIKVLGACSKKNHMSLPGLPCGLVNGVKRKVVSCAVIFDLECSVSVVRTGSRPSS